MKTKTYAFMLVVLFLLGGMTSAHASSVKVKMFNMSNLNIRVDIAGPMARVSPDHNIAPGGGSSSYNTSEWLSSSNGNYYLKVTSAKPHCVTQVTFAAPRDGQYTVTIEEPIKGNTALCHEYFAVTGEGVNAFRD